MKALGRKSKGATQHRITVMAEHPMKGGGVVVHYHAKAGGGSHCYAVYLPPDAIGQEASNKVLQALEKQDA